MTAKTKWPEKVWHRIGDKSKCYRRDRGNEVAMALNVLERNVDKYSHQMAVEDLRGAGFKVRWDAKRGKFV